jgi:bifunctional UDP-N-acetylglucosamine pyrophosphorylase/glucosamine-1-phosphate N-acetyltransferase
MKALILAGGSGKEMLPLSKYRPKSMLTLHGKHIIEYILDSLIETGIEDIVIVIGYLGEQFHSIIANYRYKGIKIQLVDQGVTTGIEGALLSANDLFSGQETFLLVYGDIIAPSKFYHHLINSFINTAADGAIAVTLVGKASEFGVVSSDDRGFVTTILPESSTGEKETNYIYAGASILPTEFFNILQDEERLTLALSRLLTEQRRICASFWQHDWIDIGYPWDLLAANQDLFKNLEYARIHKSAKISPSAHISGLVLVEKNVIIDHNAEIVGPCFIGENSYIGTNSLIREYASIEKNCKIGFSVEIKNSIILPGTRIGRLSFVGDSVIGENVGLDSGITTMNELEESKLIKGRSYNKLGSVVGSNSNIGSNAVLLPGVIIGTDQNVPPGTVIRENTM